MRRHDHFFFQMTVFFYLLFCLPLWAEDTLPIQGIRYESLDKRDPFVPLIGKGVQIRNVKFLKSVDEIHIEGILIDPGHDSAAVLNGQVFRAGDFIGGFRVESIHADEVVFSRDGETFQVHYGAASDGEADGDEGTFFGN